MATSNKYHAGRIMGMRDARNGLQAGADRNWSADYRFGYSDGYATVIRQLEKNDDL